MQRIPRKHLITFLFFTYKFQEAERGIAAKQPGRTLRKEGPAGRRRERLVLAPGSRNRIIDVEITQRASSSGRQATGPAGHMWIEGGRRHCLACAASTLKGLGRGQVANGKMR